MKYSVNKLLINGDENFLENITPSSNVHSFLLSRRKEIRNEIRNSFEVVRKSLINIGEAWDIDENTLPPNIVNYLKSLDSNIISAIKNIYPKFKTQGSFVYHTMNSPCHHGQQMDLDDGVYLPIEFLRKEPTINKNLFFMIVDFALSKYAKAKGWKFDGSKNTCSRIEIGESLHIDTPLYAIPKDKFDLILESMSSKSSIAGAKDSKNELESDEVYLAVRNSDNWIKSDPIKINNWFTSAKSIYPQKLVRVCRFLKAWRDFHWPNGGGPSSITLMVCAVSTFSSKNNFDSISEALLECSTDLYDHLKEGVWNPVDDDEPIMFPRDSDSQEHIEEVLLKAKQLSVTIRSSLISSNNPQQCVNDLITIFGSRLPDRPDLIQNEIASKIKTIPAKQIPQEETNNMNAG